VHSRLDDVFYETLARDFLARGEPEVLWRLRLDALEARRLGHQRGADLLTEIADAAQRLLRQAGKPELTTTSVDLSSSNPTV
jgi:hypothetical protein